MFIALYFYIVGILYMKHSRRRKGTEVLVNRAPANAWGRKKSPRQRHRASKPVEHKAPLLVGQGVFARPLEGDQIQLTTWQQRLADMINVENAPFLRRQHAGFGRHMLPQLHHFAYALDLVLIGGSVPDMKLGITPNDFDFLFKGTAEELQAKLAALGLNAPVRYCRTANPSAPYQYVKLDLGQDIGEIDIGILGAKSVEKHCASGGLSMKRYPVNMRTAESLPELLEKKLITTVLDDPDAAFAQDGKMPCRGLKSAARYYQHGYRYDAKTWMATHRYFLGNFGKAMTSGEYCNALRMLFCSDDEQKRENMHEVLSDFRRLVDESRLAANGFLRQGHLYDIIPLEGVGQYYCPYLHNMSLPIDLRLPVLLQYQRSLPEGHGIRLCKENVQNIMQCLDIVRKNTELDEDQRVFLLFLALRAPLVVDTPHPDVEKPEHYVVKSMLNFNTFMQRGSGQDLELVGAVRNALIGFAHLVRGLEKPEVEYDKYAKPLGLFEEIYKVPVRKIQTRVTITSPEEGDSNIKFQA